MTNKSHDYTAGLSTANINFTPQDLEIKTVPISTINNAIDASILTDSMKTAMKTISALIAKDGYVALKEFYAKVSKEIEDISSIEVINEIINRLLP